MALCMQAGIIMILLIPHIVICVCVTDSDNRYNVQVKAQNNIRYNCVDVLQVLHINKHTFNILCICCRYKVLSVKCF